MSTEVIIDIQENYILALLVALATFYVLPYMAAGLDVGRFNHHTTSSVIVWITPFYIDFGKEHVFEIFSSH